MIWKKTFWHRPRRHVPLIRMGCVCKKTACVMSFIPLIQSQTAASTATIILRQYCPQMQSCMTVYWLRCITYNELHGWLTIRQLLLYRRRSVRDAGSPSCQQATDRSIALIAQSPQRKNVMHILTGSNTGKTDKLFFSPCLGIGKASRIKAFEAQETSRRNKCLSPLKMKEKGGF